MSGAWIETPWVFRLALTLLHFVWQGGAIYAGWLVCRALMRNNSAEARYLLALVAMACLTLAPVITFFWLDPPSLHLRPSVPSEHALAAVSVDFWAVVYDYHQMIVLGWLAGVSLLALRLLLGYGTTLRLRRSFDPIGDDLAARFLRLADKLRLGRCPQIGFSGKVSQAMTIGFYRPVILLPLAWLTEMTPQVLEAVVAHELAHTKRGDLWVNLLQRLAETLLFFHPAVWWISREIRLEREYCCDEMAVAAIGSPLEYAKSLEAIATWQLGHGSNLLATPFLGERKMNLLDRVRRVLGTDSPANARKAWPLGLAILATPLLLWAFSLGMLPGQRTEVVAEPVPTAEAANPWVQPPQNGMGMEMGMGMVDMSQIRMGESRQAQAEGMGGGFAQRAQESPQNDLSPRDRAMLQMMTELRYEVMSLRYEIQQMRQPGGGNHPPQFAPWNPPGPYPNQQPLPHFGSRPGPQNAPSNTPSMVAPPASLPPSNRFVPTYSDPQEGDKTQRRGSQENTEPTKVEPQISNVPGRENFLAEAAEAVGEMFTPSGPPRATPEQKKLEQRLKEISAAKEAAEMMRRKSEEALIAAEQQRQLSERSAQEMAQRLKETRAVEQKARADAEIVRHQAEAEREHAKEKLHQTQDQLNKAVLRIKQLEDNAAEKAAETQSTEPPTPAVEPATLQPNRVD